MHPYVIVKYFLYTILSHMSFTGKYHFPVDTHNYETANIGLLCSVQLT